MNYSDFTIKHTNAESNIHISSLNAHDFDTPCDMDLCQPYKIFLEEGKYLLEVWGSSGEEVENCGSPGRGGYARGNINVINRTEIYVFVGNKKGFGGGGKPGDGMNKAGCGGGATDIRLSLNLDDRVIIAGGGGGGSSNYQSSDDRYGNTGVSGGDTGCDGREKNGEYHGKFGSRGTNESNGIGGQGGALPSTSYSGNPNRYTSTPGGGGGGYYGGGGGGSGGKGDKDDNIPGNRGNDGSFGYGGKGADACVLAPTQIYHVYSSGGGGGGSSYCSHLIHKCHIQNGDTIFTNPRNNIAETGNGGNGYARITFISSLLICSAENHYHFNFVIFVFSYLISIIQ